QRNIAARLPNQALAEMPGSDKLSFAPCERRIVHQNTHSNRRRIDIDELQWCTLLPVGKGFADVNFLESGETDNLAGAGMVYFHLLKACVGKERRNRSALAPLIARSEEHTSELQSHLNLVCRLLLEKKKKKQL